MKHLLTTTILTAVLATSAFADPRKIAATDVYETRPGTPTSTRYYEEFETGLWRVEGRVGATVYTSEELFSMVASDKYINANFPIDDKNNPYNYITYWSDVIPATGIDALNGVKGAEVNIKVNQTREQQGQGLVILKKEDYKDIYGAEVTVDGDSESYVQINVYNEGNGWVYSVSGNYDDNIGGYIEYQITDEQLKTLDITSRDYLKDYIPAVTVDDVWILEATGDYKLYGNDYVIKSNGMLDEEISLLDKELELLNKKIELQITQERFDKLIAEAKDEIVLSLKDQWSVDPVLTNKVNSNTSIIQGLQKDVNTNKVDILTNTTSINSNRTQIAKNTKQIGLNTAAIANHEIRITDNTNRLNAHDVRISNLESIIANLKLQNVHTDNDSAEVKFSREMWVRAKKAKAGNEPVYYKTTRGNVIDLRALAAYDPQHGVAVTKDYQKQMGYRSVWVGK